MQILSLTPAGVAFEGLDSTARLPGSTLALTLTTSMSSGKSPSSLCASVSPYV